MPSSSESYEPSGRVEDRRLTTGNGRYVDDLHVQGMAYLGIIRSPYAHAKIKRIDFSDARKFPDFIASVTGEDLVKEGMKHLTQLPLQKPAPRYHLAVGTTRYAGEAVAAVLAKSRYAVEDLIDAVSVEYEELPSIVTIEDSRNRKSILFEGLPDNIIMQQVARKGNAEVALKSAPFSVRTKITLARQAGTPIEPRAIVAVYDSKKDVFEVHATMQSAQRLQNYLSSEFQLPKEKFHVIVTDVGGGFGTKGAQSYPEYAIACFFSKKAGLPVRWTSTRTEDLLETASGRDQQCEVQLACDSNGKILALKADLESDAGVSGTLSVSAGLTLRLIPGSYKIPNLDLKATSYVTNKGPLGPVRGAGRPEASFFIESAMDMLAKKTGIDPLELRSRNAIQPDEFPYDNGAGFVYDSANFPLLLDVLKHSSDYTKLLEWRNENNQKMLTSEKKELAGLGISLIVEDTGSQLSETARVVLEKSGKVTVYTGSSPHGQGLETTLAQLCSEVLGVSIENVTVVYGDTKLVPVGIGTFGSRSAVAGGSAVVEASRKLRSKILETAGAILGIESVKLQIKDEQIFNDLSSSHSLLTLQQIFEKTDLNELSESSEFKMSAPTFASGAHLCAVKIDLETGKVRIEKYFAVDDCGRVINKKIVDGQIHGGVIHGIGNALLEQMVYDNDGHLLSSNFLDYLIPTALESPNIDVYHVETTSQITLNGSRGVGESGTIAAIPAVFNAVNDALSYLKAPGLNKVPTEPEEVIKVIKTTSARLS
jgi:carbon-monoxide dehydrogenase large subunit